MNEDKRSTTALVTGASGYIAMHCIMQLLQQGYIVRGSLRSLAREAGLRDTFARHIDANDALSFVTADLMSDDGWADAVSGCRFVLHVASPNLLAEPQEEEQWIVPARDGTLRVLRAAAAAGVQRVVLTSSIAAIYPGHDTDGRTFSEDDWADTEADIGAYARSKTLAERAAWQYVAELPDGKALELAVINPGLVLGPILDEDIPASIAIVGRLFGREVPGCARVGFNCVDVRDTAAAHLLAMTEPQAAGKRFICSTEFYWMQEIAAVLDNEYGARGYRIPTRVMPDMIVRLFALFDESIRRIVPALGRQVDLSSAPLRSTLNWQPLPIEQSILDTAESLIEFGP